MKSRLLISVLAVSFIAVANTGISCAYTELDTAAAIRAEGQIPFTPGALLDDFNAGAATNAWNCVTGTFAKEGSSANCTASYANNPSIVYGGTGRSLQLDYNVNDTDSYAGYFSGLGGANLDNPLTPNTVASTAISFWVRGAAGGEFFKIQIKNNSQTRYPDPLSGLQYLRDQASLYITDYLDGGVTTIWRKVTIPLKNFANLDGWDSMSELVIIFENSQSVSNGSQTQGAIYMDNVAFETGAVDVVRIDNFGDKIGMCALGGNTGTSGSDPQGNGKIQKIEYRPSGTGDNRNNLYLDYNVSDIGAWAVAYMIFGGGRAPDEYSASDKEKIGGWVAVPVDLQNYNYLSFKIKAESDALNPVEIKIELKDGSTITKYMRKQGITSSWQTYRISLSDFKNTDTPLPETVYLDKSSIKQIGFVFEGYRIGYAEGAMDGAVYIDSVQFEK